MEKPIHLHFMSIHTSYRSDQPFNHPPIECITLQNDTSSPMAHQAGRYLVRPKIIIMDALLKKLKDIRTEGCVTILLNTHRTAPDNQADPIALKKLVQEAEDRLRADYHKEKWFSTPLLDKIKVLAASIDHQHNQESLAIFVNQDIAEYTRLPIQVTPRVVVDDSFATRDLVRAMHAEAGYYVLVVNPQDARLIEAFNDRPVREHGKPFPIHNGHLYSTNHAELSNASRQSSLAAEFYNRIDKEFMKVHKEHPMPVVICAEGSTYFEYVKVADRKEVIAGQVNADRATHQAVHIVHAAWPVLKASREAANANRFSELDKAIGAGRVVFDLNEILAAIRQGRGKTIFVKPDHFIPALLEGDTITPVESHERTRKGVVDDIIDELIEENFRYGGDVVFLEGDALDKFHGLALSTRY